MKIITEDAVYVQKNDIAFLTHTDIRIPSSIFMKVFGDGVVIIGNSNRWEFVKFEGKDEIEFFKQLDWIIDYNNVKNLNEEEFIKMGQLIVEEKNKIAKEYNEMSIEECQKNYNMVLQYEMLEHKMYSLRDILWFKKGQLEMDLPLIPDEKGFSFVGNDDYKYQIKSSIDPNKLLLFRKDGKPLTSEDVISPIFIQTGMSIAIMKKQEKDEFFGNYEVNKYLTDDNQYLVIEFKVKSHDFEQEEKSSKKLIKKIRTILKK